VLHQRPENLHDVVRDMSAVGDATTGVGHSASIAAMIATASASVGAGETEVPTGGGSKDTSVLYCRCPSQTSPITCRYRVSCTVSARSAHGRISG
jgi:hypothetical protein